jgi:tRNA pseudouridine65 synthase
MMLPKGFPFTFAKRAQVLSYFPESGLLFLSKPAGIKCHPNLEATVDTKALVHAPYDFKRESFHLIEKDREIQRSSRHRVEQLYLLHRLDSPTTGVIALCHNRFVTASQVRMQFAAKKVLKTYYTVVGVSPDTVEVPLEKGSIVEWVDKTLAQNSLHTSPRSQHHQSRQPVWARTLCEVLDILPLPSVPEDHKYTHLALLKLEPLTGRTHQLRIQCRQRNAPIIGDKTYGDFAFNRQAVTLVPRITGQDLFLHCGKLQFSLPVYQPHTQGRPMPAKEETIEAQDDLPAHFRRLFLDAMAIGSPDSY